MGTNRFRGAADEWGHDVEIAQRRDKSYVSNFRAPQNHKAFSVDGRAEKGRPWPAGRGGAGQDC